MDFSAMGLFLSVAVANGPVWTALRGGMSGTSPVGKLVLHCNYLVSAEVLIDI